MTRPMLLMVAACGAAPEAPAEESGSPPAESPTDTAGCVLGEPLSIEAGLPAGVWIGTRRQLDAAGGLLQEGTVTVEIDDDLVITEFSNEAWWSMSMDGFRFDAEGIAWLDPNGVEIGACSADLGTLHCTITDPQHAVQGDKDLEFSTGCLWVDERMELDGTVESAHSVLAPG